MSDFIGRKELMERVLKEEYDNDIHTDGRAKVIHHGEYRHFQKVIAEMPTAYDLESVIEQMEKRKKYLMEEFVLSEKSLSVKEISLARINELEGIIEIVKSGISSTDGNNGG